MRQVKFRGKNNSGKWVYGSLVWTEGQQPKIYFPIFFSNNPKKLLKWDWVYVDAKTVGQYIGIIDTSTPPKEIYDGDIIEGKSGMRHLIKYDDDSAALLVYKLPLNEFDNGCYIDNDWVVKFKKKVIGNKFDNPEMVTSEY